MPNPISEKIEVISPLSEKHYALIGKIACGWTAVELEIALMVASLSASKVKSMLFIFQGLSARGKLEAASSVLSVDGFDQESKAFLPLLEEAKTLSAIRHAAVHSIWIGVTKRGALVAADIETRKQSPNIGRISWTEKELVAAVSSIKNLASRLREFSDDYGLRELPDFS
ncbi:MAG: hypothetical protein KGH70_02630 [Rhodospirillales bacterium]|nr:hypothetical protein [Rhodospirillales bacterium]